MPTDGNFGFSVLIAGLSVPEYSKDGTVYVESNLWTPVSYMQLVKELVYGEVEEQEWPVTPYQLNIYAEPHCLQSMFHVYVDGVRTGESCVILSGGQSEVHKGFEDANGVKEFLFALPRFARDEKDRVQVSRKTKIGTIEVVRLACTYLGNELVTGSDTQFDQANKKDTSAVTRGQYTMSTTKKGKVIKSLEHQWWSQIWQEGAELGRLSVAYRMAHTLQDMGITIQLMDWTQGCNLTTKSE